jgi:hypothetical protein
MRLNSAPFAIGDERIREPGQRTWGNWLAIRWSNLTDNTVRGNGGRANHVTPNLLPTLHRILYPNTRSQIPSTRCDLSTNPILRPADCLCSWYRQTEKEYSSFDQSTGENIELSTKFSVIGIRKSPAFGLKSRKASCPRTRFWAANPWLDSTKHWKYRTSYESRNQAVLCRPTPSSSHSGLGKFVISSEIHTKGVPQEEHPL